MIIIERLAEKIYLLYLCFILVLYTVSRVCLPSLTRFIKNGLRAFSCIGAFHHNVLLLMFHKRVGLFCLVSELRSLAAIR